MTVEATPRKAGPFDGNGITDSFPFDFKVFAKTDLRVVRTNAASVETDLVLDSDYFVTLNVDQDATPGGTVDYSGPPLLPVGWKLTILGATPFNQVTDITNVGRFNPNVLEQTIDRTTIQVQQLVEGLTRAVQVPVSSDSSPETLIDDLVEAAADATSAAGAAASSAATAATQAGNAASSASAAATQAGNAAADAIAAAASAAAASGAALAQVNTFKADLANTADVAKGAAYAGFNPALAYAAGTVGAQLRGPEATFKGRATGSGTGGMVDLTAAQARTILNGTAWDLAAGTVDLTKSVSGAVAPSPPLNITVTDTLNIAGNFAFGAAILLNRDGGTGHREAATARITSNNAPASEFCVGFHGLARIQTGSGNAFGLNGYAWVDAAALATAEICGGEMNTDARRSVNRKVGLQVVDVATSTGAGTAYDAGIIIGRQTGGNGYNIGISFGFDGTTGFGVQLGGTFISAPTSTTSFRAGLDLAGISTWSVAPILLRPNSKGIWWGTTAEGGSVISETAAGGGIVTFLNGETRVKFGSTNCAAWTIRDTFLIVRTGADGAEIFRRLIAGAADSGGAGYRALRVEN